MATEKPRFTITLSEDLYEKVNEYQHDMRFSTQTKAIVDLIERGAKSLGLVMDYESFSLDSNIKAPSISDEAMKIAKDYESLDGHGKSIVRIIISEEQRRIKEFGHLECRPMIRAAAYGGGVEQIQKINPGEVPTDEKPLP